MTNKCKDVPTLAVSELLLLKSIAKELVRVDPVLNKKMQSTLSELCAEYANLLTNEQRETLTPEQREELAAIESYNDGRTKQSL